MVTLHLGELVVTERTQFRVLVPTNRKWWQFWKPSHEWRLLEVGGE